MGAEYISMFESEFALEDEVLLGGEGGEVVDAAVIAVVDGEDGGLVEVGGWVVGHVVVKVDVAEVGEGGGDGVEVSEGEGSGDDPDKSRCNTAAS
ncbi:hypothetical protein ES702_01195 [subsurface metagenome]